MRYVKPNAYIPRRMLELTGSGLGLTDKDATAIVAEEIQNCETTPWAKPYSRLRVCLHRSQHVHPPVVAGSCNSCSR